MAQSDWEFLTDGLGSSDVARGVSAGFTPPNGGGTYVFGFKSLTSNQGTVIKVGNKANFHPIGTGIGCSVRGAIQRNGDTGATLMVLGALDSDSVAANGYLLGFTQDEEPSHLVLVKGSPDDGLLSTTGSYLRMSTATFPKGTWAHVRLDILVQPQGDVFLQVFSSDLVANPVADPSWAAISGMAEYVDDALGINSGSIPYSSGGYAGLGYHTEAIGRWAIADHLQIARGPV